MLWEYQQKIRFICYYYDMGKLFNLLNEYITSKWWDEIKGYVQMYRFFFTEYLENIPEYVVISRKFWFIKWLVEEDKIDYWKIGEIVNGYKWSLREKAFVVDDCVYESMLMLLSIQDEPASLLASILK